MKKVIDKLNKYDSNLIYLIGLISFILIVGSFAIGIINALIIVLIISGSYYIYKGVFMKKKKKVVAVKTVNKKKNVKSKKSIGNKIFYGIMYATILVFVLGIGFCAYIVISAPDFNPEKLYVKEKSLVYDSDNNVIAELGAQKRDKVTYDELPEVLIDAIIATEDSNFFQHNGVDLGRFTAATVSQLLGKYAGGASTLTMQIAKNQYNGSEQTITRKFTDIYISVFKLEKEYSKESIMEFYVNIPYLGGGSYGVSQASMTYFNKNVKDLTLPEAATIAGLFQAPSALDPLKNPEKAQKRRDTVLYLMERHGYITEEQEMIAKSIDVADLIKNDGKNTNSSSYQSFVEYAADEVLEKTGLSPYSTPMNIYTTLETDKQDHLNKVLAGEIYKFKDDVVQTGIAVTDVKTGAIAALGAGRNRNGELVYNYATDIKRQIGSTAKPVFDYGPAFEYNNWSPAHPIVDEPYTYSDDRPIKNSDGGYYGKTTVRNSLAGSRNIPALKTFQQVKNKKIIEFVQKLGLKPEIENGKIHEAHSIGAFNGSNPLEMSAAYGAFGNQGKYTEPYSVLKIELIDTDEVKDFVHNQEQVMSTSTAFMITDILNKGVNYGQISATKIPGVNFAAKTGTTNFDKETIESKGLSSNALNDLWLVGYDQQYSIGMWFGYDKISSEHHFTTSNWTDRRLLFNAISKGIFEKTGKTFEVPDTVVRATIEKGVFPYMLASDQTPDEEKLTDYFKVGYEPTEISDKYMKLPEIVNPAYTNDENTITLSWDTPVFVDSIGVIKYNIYLDNVKVATTDRNYYEIELEADRNYEFVIKTEFSNYVGESEGSSIKVKLEQKEEEEKPTTNEPVFSLKGDSIVNLLTGDTFNDEGISVMFGELDVTDSNNTNLISKTITDDANNIVTSIDTTTPITYTIEYKVEYVDVLENKVYEQTLIREVIIKEEEIN